MVLTLLLLVPKKVIVHELEFQLVLEKMIARLYLVLLLSSLIMWSVTALCFYLHLLEIIITFKELPHH